MKTFNKNEDYIFEIIHDLKAPILSMDFALKGVERDDFLEEIYKLNRHNLNYIENLMTGWMLSKGKYCPKFELIDLIRIVKEEIRVLNFLITEKNLTVVLSLDKTDTSVIISDKYLVRQIILNILTNAVKYTPINGKINIVFEKKENFLNVCFSNPDNKKLTNVCSSKMGLEIVKRKLKVLKGRLKVIKTNGEICFRICFECA